MKLNHSKEPWIATPYSGTMPAARFSTITTADGKQCVAAIFGDSLEQSDANRDRIIACVNFCQHLPTTIIKQLTEQQIGPDTMESLLRNSLRHNQD